MPTHKDHLKASNAYVEANPQVVAWVARRTGATPARVEAIFDTMTNREITLTEFVRLVEQDIAGGR